MEDGIGLASFIDELRRELSVAMASGEGKSARFIANSIDIELKVHTERGKDGKAGLSFKVFGVGVEGGGGLSSSAADTQTLKLSLKLVGRDGSSPLISAEDVGA